MQILLPVERTPGLFMGYQKRWIADFSRLKIMEKSRQIGMTMAAAYRAVETTAVGTFDTWVSSRDEAQGALFIADCAKWARALSQSASRRGRDMTGRRAYLAGSIHFASGRTIAALSSSIDAQAGKRGSRILDEFALHEDPRRLFAVAYPGITWGGSLEILSTHRGSGNFFSALIREAREGGNPKGFSLHRVTLEDAVAEGLLEKLKQRLPPEDPRASMTGDEYLEYVKRGCPDEESWLEEYCCQPSDDAAAFLPLALIRDAEYAVATGVLSERKSPEWDWTLAELRAAKNPLYLGVDLGREKDLTVFWLLELNGGTAFTRKLVTLERTPFSEQEERLYELLSLPNLRRATLDASGLGRQFAERAAQKFGERRVEGLTLTAPLKESLAYPLKAAFENGMLRIPPAPGLRADLRSVRRECGAGGILRFTAERGSNGHADRFWALALALRAARVGEEARTAYAERLGSNRGIVI
jgi:phage FluMu gp28-like protein